MKIDPKDPTHHGKPLWVVYGPKSMPSVVCANLWAYTSSHIKLSAGQAGPIVCIWGYSVYKGEPGFRTLGQNVETWAKESTARYRAKPVFFDTQAEALEHLRKLTTPHGDSL